jgi:hypothetical protein
MSKPNQLARLLMMALDLHGQDRKQEALGLLDRVVESLSGGGALKRRDVFAGLAVALESALDERSRL